MFLVPFFDLQNFILLVRTVPFPRKIIFIGSYTAKCNYFLLYELIQDLPYISVVYIAEKTHQDSKIASRYMYIEGDSNFKIEALNQSINQFNNFVI